MFGDITFRCSVLPRTLQTIGSVNHHIHGNHQSPASSYRLALQTGTHVEIGSPRWRVVTTINKTPLIFSVPGRKYLGTLFIHVCIYMLKFKDICNFLSYSLKFYNFNWLSQSNNRSTRDSSGRRLELLTTGYISSGSRTKYLTFWIITPS